MEKLTQDQLDQDIEVFYNIAANKTIARQATERYKKLIEADDVDLPKAFDVIITYIMEYNESYQ